MKILLDENLPLDLKRSFGPDHDVFSVRDLRWSGMKNGELLRLMTAEGFNVFVTMDQNLPNQQNLAGSTLTIFILRGVNNKFRTLSDFIPLVLKEIELGIKPGILQIKK
jgi:predicted nuclease of predicted toxin-antitoxin system